MIYIQRANEARRAFLIMIISYPARLRRIMIFIKNPTTHIWESEEKKMKERNAALQKTERK